jgi:phosphoglycolate phosphatase
MIRAVVLDVDDTLCLTEAVCFDLENDVLARIGRPPMPRSVHRATWGMTLFAALPLRSPGVDLDAFAGAYDAVRDAYVAAGRLDAIPEANLAALDRLVRDGRLVLLLTSRTAAEVAHLLAPDHRLAARLAAGRPGGTTVYHGGNMRYAKPDARAFDELLADTGLAPQQCVYVGDSPGDAQAATGAGLRFVACLEGGIRSRADFAAYPVDAFVDTFPAVVEVVLNA